MANEFRHGSTVSEDTLYQSDWEKTTIHRFNSQATGDTLYASSSTQLSKLAIGSNNNILTISSGVPAWTSTPTLAGLTISGDIALGANKLKTTNLLLKEQDSSFLTIRNAADDADRGLSVSGTSGIIQAYDFRGAGDAAWIKASDSNDRYLRFGARDTDVGQVEVARLQGAADPYFSMGGSQQIRFYYSGYVHTTEKAAAATNVATFGEYWVKSDAPNIPMFTDDTGADHQLLTGATGTKHEFHLPFEDPTGAVGNWDVVEINAAQDTHFTFQVPESFESLVNAKVVMIPDATETIQWDMNASVAAAGEAHDNDDRTAADQTLAVTADQLTEVDISGQLTGLTPGDYVGIDFQSDIANLRIIGFEFDYL